MIGIFQHDSDLLSFLPSTNSGVEHLISIKYHPAYRYKWQSEDTLTFSSLKEPHMHATDQTDKAVASSSAMSALCA